MRSCVYLQVSKQEEVQHLMSTSTRRLRCGRYWRSTRGLGHEVLDGLAGDEIRHAHHVHDVALWPAPTRSVVHSTRVILGRLLVHVHKVDAVAYRPGLGLPQDVRLNVLAAVPALATTDGEHFVHVDKKTPQIYHSAARGPAGGPGLEVTLFDACGTVLACSSTGWLSRR